MEAGRDEESCQQFYWAVDRSGPEKPRLLRGSAAEEEGRPTSASHYCSPSKPHVTISFFKSPFMSTADASAG